MSKSAAKADVAKKVRSLIKSVKPLDREPLTALLPDHGDAVVHELVYSLLIWEATPSQALNALKRLFDGVVDYNELRICMADEIAALLGPRYPLVDERAERLKAALHHVYNLEHEVTLARLNDVSKRDAKAYLEGLEGVPPFVVARVILVALGGHAAPIDQRLRDQLVAAKTVDDSLDAATIASQLERNVRANESLEFFAKLEAWRDAAPTPKHPRTAPAAPPLPPVSLAPPPAPKRETPPAAEPAATTPTKKSAAKKSTAKSAKKAATKASPAKASSKSAGRAAGKSTSSKSSATRKSASRSAGKASTQKSAAKSVAKAATKKTAKRTAKKKAAPRKKTASRSRAAKSS